RAPIRTMARQVTEAGMQAVLDTGIGRMFPPEFARKHPRIIAARKAALVTVDPQCFARACLALAALDLSSSAEKIQNPTLVLCGALESDHAADAGARPGGAHSWCVLRRNSGLGPLPDARATRCAAGENGRVSGRPGALSRPAAQEPLNQL